MSFCRSKGVSGRTLGGMADVSRIRVTWSGTPVVGPGVSTFYLQGSTAAGWPAALVTLFTALKNYVPTGVTWTVPGTIDILDEATGELTGSQSLTGGGNVLSSGGAVDYKPGVGGRIRWVTSGVRDGRRVVGTTFLVPMTSQETPNGQIQGLTVGNIATAANAYRSTAGIVPAVYSRPRVAQPSHVPPISARVGASFAMTGVSVPTGITWLRSRRT